MECHTCHNLLHFSQLGLQGTFGCTIYPGSRRRRTRGGVRKYTSRSSRSDTTQQTRAARKEEQYRTHQNTETARFQLDVQPCTICRPPDRYLSCPHTLSS